MTPAARGGPSGVRSAFFPGQGEQQSPSRVPARSVGRAELLLGSHNPGLTISVVLLPTTWLLLLQQETSVGIKSTSAPIEARRKTLRFHLYCLN